MTITTFFVLWGIGSIAACGFNYCCSVVSRSHVDAGY
jgi:hypothetical protein